MSQEIEELRRDVDGLIKERDALLGQVIGLYKAVAAIIQTLPDREGFHLALHRLIDAQNLGRVRPLTEEGSVSRKNEQQVIESLLSLQPSRPPTWKPHP